MAYLQLDTWMKAEGHDARCHYRVDTLQGIQAGVRDGLGVAVLPRYLGDADDHLVALSDSVPALATELWLLTHTDLRKVARIRAFTAFVADTVKSRPDLQPLEAGNEA